VIAIEDLRIPNMARNRHLAKSIMDFGWGYFRQHLAHKAAEALDLSIRWVYCSCGLSLDRDENAARNILTRAGRARWEPTSAMAGVSQEASPL